MIASFGVSAESTPGEGLCQFQKNIFRNANELFGRGQYLLSSSQYLLLFNSKCKNLFRKARYNYSLAMVKLGENREIVEQYRFFLEHELPEREQLKSVIAFSTNDLQNENVKIWNSLTKEEVRKKFLIKNRDMLSTYDEYNEKINTKNPYIAGTLSALLPGAGQAYNGAYQSAAISLILNSIFLLGTIEFANNDLDAPAIASGLVFSVTYLGSIMNAVRGSNSINSRAAAVPKEKIKRFLFPILEIKY